VTAAAVCPNRAIQRRATSNRLWQAAGSASGSSSETGARLAGRPFGRERPSPWEQVAADLRRLGSSLVSAALGGSPDPQPPDADAGGPGRAGPDDPGLSPSSRPALPPAAGEPPAVPLRDPPDRWIAQSGDRVTVGVENLAAPQGLDLALALRQQLPERPEVRWVDDVDYANRQIVVVVDPTVFNRRAGRSALVAAVAKIEEHYSAGP